MQPGNKIELPFMTKDSREIQNDIKKHLILSQVLYPAVGLRHAEQRIRVSGSMHEHK